MDTVKIIKKYFDKKEVKKAAGYFKEQLKKNNDKATIEIIEADKIHSSLRKQLGSPKEGDFIIIIKRKVVDNIKAVVKKVAKKVKTFIKRVFKPLKATKQPYMESITHGQVQKVYLSPVPTSQNTTIVVPISLCRRA